MPPTRSATIAAAVGFFGDGHTPGVCAFGGARPGSPGAAFGVLVAAALLARSRRLARTSCRGSRAPQGFARRTI